MNYNYKELSKLKERMGKMKNLINNTIELAEKLPSIENGQLYVMLNPGELQVKAPYDLNEYKKFRKELGKDWEFIGRYFHDSLGDWFYQFSHKKTEINFCLQLALEDKPEEGQTCYRKKVGEIKRPVYEMVCD